MSNMDINIDDIRKALQYPKTLKYNTWIEYLGRRLTHEEYILLENCKSEKHLNGMLKDLYRHCIDKTYYVPMLTGLIGNCLFESLVYHKIGTNVEELRVILSVIFYIFKDYKNFLPNMSETLTDLFAFSNEIEYIYTTNKTTGEKSFYKYNYVAMCQDLGNSCCWTRLPTQLILLVVSYLYKVVIVIVHSDTGYETKINAYDGTTNTKTDKIYLGLLGESHYVPIDILDSDDEIDPMYYTLALKKLDMFGKYIEDIKIKTFLNSKESKYQTTDNVNVNEINKSNNTFSELNKNDLDENAEVEF